MSRLMSVAFTEQAVRDRCKTVTRRLGWRFLKPGERLTLCRKVMGRKPGEALERIAEVEVISVRREPLDGVSGRRRTTPPTAGTHRRVGGVSMSTVECSGCGEWATELCEVCSAPLCDMCLCPEDDPDPEDQ